MGFLRALSSRNVSLYSFKLIANQHSAVGSPQHCEDVRVLRGWEALLHRDRVSLTASGFNWIHAFLAASWPAFLANIDFDYFIRICKGGELFDEIIARGKFTEKDASVLMKQVLQCVNYCHSNHIVHRYVLTSSDSSINISFFHSFWERCCFY